MRLVFHIFEDGSEISKGVVEYAMSVISGHAENDDWTGISTPSNLF
jgi:hypothetical protein